MNPATVWTLLRPRAGSGMPTGLQIVAPTVSAVLSFATSILAVRFWNAPDDSGGHRILAVALAGLLIVPLVTLGTAAARLAARSRDDRLATLRLLGVSSHRVRALAVMEATMVAAVGVLVGSILALLLPFPLSLLTVQGRPLEPGELWLPTWMSVLIGVLLVAIAAGSALLGLRRVVLSPLGVRQRTDAPRLSRVRLLLAAIAVVGGILLLQLASPSWGTTGLIGAVTVVVLIVMGVLGIVGPFAVAAVAEVRARATSDPATLVASRRNREDPRAAWRQVSTIALASFVLVPAGSMLGFLDAVQSRSTVLTADQLLLFADARTMLMVLIAMSFLVVACHVAITQTAALLEHRALYIALDRIGMSRRTMNRARRQQITAPVLIAVIGSALVAAALTFPLLAVAATNSPVPLVATLLLLTIGVGIVRLGVETTTPVLRRVLTQVDRAE